jgi:hypothetical protein
MIGFAGANEFWQATSMHDLLSHDRVAGSQGSTEHWDTGEGHLILDTWLLVRLFVRFRLASMDQHTFIMHAWKHGDVSVVVIARLPSKVTIHHH